MKSICFPIQNKFFSDLTSTLQNQFDQISVLTSQITILEGQMQQLTSYLGQLDPSTTNCNIVGW